MPVRTGRDVYSEEKIYPGHGITFVRRDGKSFDFARNKTEKYFLANRKALKYRWTRTWRRANKKESIYRQIQKGKGVKTLKFCRFCVIRHQKY